ncbi:hypothetical protein EV121DRAFT_290685 [Schizophyllum commune]
MHTHFSDDPDAPAILIGTFSAVFVKPKNLIVKNAPEWINIKRFANWIVTAVPPSSPLCPYARPLSPPPLSNLLIVHEPPIPTPIEKHKRHFTGDSEMRRVPPLACSRNSRPPPG